MNRHRARRTDAHQSAIIDAIEQLPGCAVESLSDAGRGVPDLLIAVALGHDLAGYAAVNVLGEVKRPGEPLTPAQEDFGGRWPAPVLLLWDAAQARRALQSFRDELLTQIGVRP